VIAVLVDTEALLKVVWVSLVAGIGVIVAFSLAVLGGIRGADARRSRGGAAAVPYYALAVLAVAACLWALYRGYLFVVEKS
jgi:hypothetical protein